MTYTIYDLHKTPFLDFSGAKFTYGLEVGKSHLGKISIITNLFLFNNLDNIHKQTFKLGLSKYF